MEEQQQQPEAELTEYQRNLYEQLGVRPGEWYHVAVDSEGEPIIIQGNFPKEPTTAPTFKVASITKGGIQLYRGELKVMETTMDKLKVYVDEMKAYDKWLETKNVERLHQEAQKPQPEPNRKQRRAQKALERKKRGS